MTMPAERHKLKRISDNSRRELVLNAISDIDPTSEIMNDAYEALSSLSSNTIVEEIDASDESVFEWLGEPEKFEAWATIYVSLNYGGKQDHVSMTDSYPAVIKGVFKEGGVEFTNIDVDVSSFMD